MEHDRAVDLVDRQLVDDEVVKEFDGVVNLQALVHRVLHAVRAGAHVAEDRELAVVAGFEECAFELFCELVGDFEYALALERHAAAIARDVVGDDDVIACAVAELHHDGAEVALVVVAFRRAHHARRAAREIDDLRAAFLRGLRRELARLRHPRIPERQLVARDGARLFRDKAHELRAEDAVRNICTREAEAHGRACRLEIRGHLFRAREACWRHVAVAELLRERARVYGQRARRLAEAVDGTRLVAEVFIVLLEALEALGVFARDAQAADFALHGRALARRERQEV